MAIVRWSPFGTFAALEREMQDMLDRMSSFRPRTEREEPLAWRPRVDVFREKDAMIVEAELPGLDPDKDIELTVENQVLRIGGHRTLDREVEEGNLYLRERSFGSFAREILLPDGVDTEALDAKYEGGVLTVRIPMPIEVQGGARKIPISFETTEEEVLEAGSEH